MSQPNNWRTKREEQHEAHNRKPGAARWWKEKRNKFLRRSDKKIRGKQADTIDLKYIPPHEVYETRIEGPIEVMITKNAQNGHRVLDLLDEETRDQLSKSS